jgi:uncharacterized protein YcaQ
MGLDSDVYDSYAKEAVKEFTLRRLHLTPGTLGTREEDVPTIVRDIGGLQYGGHLDELFSRFEDFRPEWFDRLYEDYTLIEGHVLRGALRIVDAGDYPFYFNATRSVARRRRYQNCPAELGEDHALASRVLDEHGPLTIKEFKELFREGHPQCRSKAGRLLQDLYNHGEVARMGRRKQKPLFHMVEKLPYKLDLTYVTEGEAMEWLLLKCLAVHGPFTVRDIAHWVGWNLTETRETLRGLFEEGKVVRVNVEGDEEANYLRVEDVSFLNSLAKEIPEHTFIRILFNDDALLLGCYKRLGSYFGYEWEYPQFSDGVVWRAAILEGREIAGEADVEMFTRSPSFRLRSLTLRRELARPETVSRVEEAFSRLAEFKGKSFVTAKPRLV